MVSVSPKNGKIEAVGRLETRSIFISHSHADRGLARGLIELVEAVFSGVVVPFASSDPAPTGGLMPGDEWFSQIHARLREAEAVWVVATPYSITRPWIYWESGMGRAICPAGLVVVRVGLATGEVPSPLSALQSYDGLSEGDEGVGVMLGKVATQIGMKPPPDLVEKYVAHWISLAKAHKPDIEAVGPAPSVSPEQLDRLEAIIARLEASVPAFPEVLPPVPALDIASAAQARRRREEARQDLRRRMREREERRRRVLGDVTGMYEDVAEWIAAVEAAPPDVIFQALEIDGDGDALITATRGGEAAQLYLHSSALPTLAPQGGVQERTGRLIDDILKLYEAWKVDL